MAVGWDTRDSRSCARPLSYIRRRWAGTVATWMASGGQDRRGKDRRASLGQRLDAVLRRGVAVGGVDTAVAANGWPRPRRIEGQRVTMVVGGGCGRLQTSTRVHSYEIQVCCPIVVAGARDGGARGGWWWKRSGPIARFERYGAASPGCEGLPVKVFRSRSPDWGHAAPARTDSNTVQCDGGRRVRLCAARSLKAASLAVRSCQQPILAFQLLCVRNASQQEQRVLGSIKPHLAGAMHISAIVHRHHGQIPPCLSRR